MLHRFSRTPSAEDRDRWIRAGLAQQRGRLDDILVDDAHAPDAIDAQALGHCRVTIWAAVTPPPTRSHARPG